MTSRARLPPSVSILPNFITSQLWTVLLPVSSLATVKTNIRVIAQNSLDLVSIVIHWSALMEGGWMFEEGRWSKRLRLL